MTLRRALAWLVIVAFLDPAFAGDGNVSDQVRALRQRGDLEDALAVADRIGSSVGRRRAATVLARITPD